MKMNHRLRVRIIHFAVLLLLSLKSAESKEFDLFYMGGQSNMDGFGLNTELPDYLTTSVPNVFIFHGNPSPDGYDGDLKGEWQKVRAGHGRGFSTHNGKNNYGEKFGPELSFAHTISKQYPDKNIAIIKYSKGGTSIDCKAAREYGCWEVDFSDNSGINQYDHYLATLKNASADNDIDGDGVKDNLVPRGIIWMQGESDAYVSEEVARSYEKNLSKLISAIRKSLGSDGIPVVIGQISDSGQDADGKVWDYGDIVKQAQENFVKVDNNAILVNDTQTYQYSDKHHYDSQAYIDLGQKFANSIIELSNKTDLPSK